MTELTLNQLMAYLTSRRMASLGNIASHFDRPVTDLIPLVQTLQEHQRLRAASSRCQSDCSQCASCGPESAPAVLSDRTILISLESSTTCG